MKTAVHEQDCKSEIDSFCMAGEAGAVLDEKRMYLLVKRIFDVVVAIIGLAICAIPMLIISIAIRRESPGPAIFRQKRIGKDGKIFEILKFRTMRIEAPSEKVTREFEDIDDYVTKLGSFLRRTSIDELPQLVNILKGEMSFVGYRPVCVTETELNNLRMAYGVFAVQPGLTGLAQVFGRDGLGYQKKAEIDAEYVRHRGIWLDLWCILKTFVVVFSGEGAI